MPDTRLYNAYFEQSFYNNALNIRIGQQAADVEFFDSETDDLFINGTFGWPAIKASNLPAGGPAPPIAAVGIRVRAALSDRITAFATHRTVLTLPSGVGESNNLTASPDGRLLLGISSPCDHCTPTSQSAASEQTC